MLLFNSLIWVLLLALNVYQMYIHAIEETIQEINFKTSHYEM